MCIRDSGYCTYPHIEGGKMRCYDPEEIARFFGAKKDAGRNKKQEAPALADRRWRPLVTSVLAIYLVFQLLFPLRWLLLPGVVDWSTIGQRFSWRMKISTRNPQQIALTSGRCDAYHFAPPSAS